MEYAQALSDWAEARGYEAETLWDMCTTAALGIPYEKAQWRAGAHALRRRAEAAGAGGAAARHRRGAAARRAGQLSRRARQALAGGAAARRPARRCCSSPTTGSCWPAPREKIVSVEPSPAGSGRLGARRRLRHVPRGAQGAVRPLRGAAAALGRGARPAEEAGAHAAADRPRSATSMASRYQAAQTRLQKFEEAGPPPEPPREQDITHAAARRAHRRAGRHLRGAGADRPDEAVRPGGLLRRAGRGPRLQRLRQVALPAAAGRGRRPVAHTGAWKLGARVVPGPLRADARPPRAAGPHPARHPVDRARQGPGRGDVGAAPLRAGAARPSSPSTGSPAASRPASRSCCWSWPGTTALLLDEPTDNLDLESAEALQEGLEAYEGTVLAVTHDRWFARSFDRYLVFGADGRGAGDGGAGVGRAAGGAGAVRRRRSRERAGSGAPVTATVPWSRQ